MDVLAMEFPSVQVGSVIVADATNVVGAETPALAGNDRGGDLTAEHELSVERLHLRAQFGERADGENSVGGVFADAQNVEFHRGHRNSGAG